MSEIRIHTPRTPVRGLNPQPQEELSFSNNMWKSCCGASIDRRIALFFTQAIISGMVLMFCIFQLIFNSSCETDPVYVGLLSSTLGFWLPQPKM